MASSEFEDLAHVCDRVFVFRGGRVVSVLAGDALTGERLLEQCYCSPAGRSAAS